MQKTNHLSSKLHSDVNIVHSNVIVVQLTFLNILRIGEAITCPFVGCDHSIGNVQNEIADVMFEMNPLTHATSELGSLSTQYRRNLYFQECFSILQPREYLYERTQKNYFFLYINCI